MEFMAVSSYGSATSSSGVVRILKDLDRDISDKHVLVIEDIIDSGLTLSWLLKNLGGRRPASLEVCALLRKPDAVKVDVPVRYVGFDIPNEFVDRKSTRLNSSHANISYAVFCLKKKHNTIILFFHDKNLTSTITAEQFLSLAKKHNFPTFNYAAANVPPTEHLSHSTTLFLDLLP